MSFVMLMSQGKAVKRGVDVIMAVMVLVLEDVPSASGLIAMGETEECGHTILEKSLDGL